MHCHCSSLIIMDDPQPNGSSSFQTCSLSSAKFHSSNVSADSLYMIACPAELEPATCILVLVSNTVMIFTNVLMSWWPCSRARGGRWPRRRGRWSPGLPASLGCWSGLPVICPKYRFSTLFNFFWKPCTYFQLSMDFAPRHSIHTCDVKDMENFNVVFVNNAI